MRSYTTIEGWFDFERLYDEQIACAAAGSILVEVGCWFGRSLVYLAQAAQRSQKSLRVYGVDHGRGSQEHAAAMAARGETLVGTLAQNLWECGVADAVDLIVAPSDRAAGLFKPASVDFVFIDAAHDYDSVLADLNAWWPKIRPGGVLAGHDYRSTYFGGVTQAVNEFFGEDDCASPASPSCWQVAKARRKSPARRARSTSRRR